MGVGLNTPDISKNVNFKEFSSSKHDINLKTGSIIQNEELNEFKEEPDLKYNEFIVYNEN